MIIDARELEDGFSLDADLCIAGTGAAGLTLASQLEGSGLSICLLESGGLGPDPETQRLYEGAYEGSVPTRNYLTQTRLRFFGGTTNHWAGWCRPLEPIDFEVRSWVPESGWPFPKTHLDPYYRRAENLLRLGSFELDNPDAGDPELPSPLDDESLQGRLFQRRRVVFSTEFGELVRESSNVRLLHHANVVEVVPSESGRAAEAFRVATLSGVRGIVRAKAFVLATGGIENCRILLGSDARYRNGIGNRHDRVGRFFNDHVVLRRGPGPMAVWPEVSLDLYQWRGDPARAQLLYLSEDAIRRRQLLSCSLIVTHRKGPQARQKTTPFDEQAAAAFYDLDRIDQPRRPDATPRFFQTYFVCEQQPNAESRVTLTPDRDALGMRRVKLDWKLSGAEISTIDAFAEMLGRGIAGRGDGRLRTAVAKQDFVRRMGHGAHHNGTTRMHSDPKRGVVDPDCRVHGIDNLYVAGSSVFPTSGAANPTLTIVALAIRMADRLRQQIRKT